MRPDGPRIANVMLGGIWGDDPPTEAEMTVSQHDEAVVTK